MFIDLFAILQLSAIFSAFLGVHLYLLEYLMPTHTYKFLKRTESKF